jgi:hypothetical protein
VVQHLLGGGGAEEKLSPDSLSSGGDLHPGCPEHKARVGANYAGRRFSMLEYEQLRTSATHNRARLQRSCPEGKCSPLEQHRLDQHCVQIHRSVSLIL